MNLPEQSQREQIAREIQPLMAEHSDRLQRLAWTIVRDWPLAADAVQETFALLAQRLVEVPVDRREGWLVKTVQFQAHNLRRKQHRAAQLPAKLAEQGLACGPQEPLSVEQRMERDEQLRQLQAAIAGLPEAQRVVVLGRLGEGKTFAELADELQLPLGTVLSRMRLGLEKLRMKFDAS